MIALAAPRLFDGTELLRNRVVTVDADRIISVSDRAPAGAAVEALAPDTILAPGFVDLQVNGGGGIMLNDDVTVEAMGAIAAAHARAGSTSILPTLISGSRDQVRQALIAAEAALAQAVPGIVGLHLEGPHISAARHGIHPTEAIVPMEDADLALVAAPRALKLLLTIAPDVVEIGKIASLARSGVVVFAGHTDASYELMCEALSAGVAGFTHLFNAMSQFGSRAPGAVGAAMTHRDAFASIIVDGHHVHPAAVAAAYSTKGAGHLFLVSDAMATVGTENRQFILCQKLIRLEDGRLTDDAGKLAGAHLTMAEAVRNAVHLAGVPLAGALRMATSTVAACMGMDDRGRLAVGCRADLVALDHDLRVTAVWQDGRRI